MKFILAFLFIAPIAAFAVDNPDATTSTVNDPDIAAIQKTLDDCMSKADSDFAMGNCSIDAQRNMVMLLDQAYVAKDKSHKAQGDNDGRETRVRLLDAELAWVKYRNRECNYEGASMLGGTGEPLEIGSCLYEKTKSRIVELRNDP